MMNDMGNKAIRIRQERTSDLLQTKKTVDWLVNNTDVRVFNPVDFTGYQRSIDEKHCKRIVSYILDNAFFLPTAITCAIDDDFSENARLRIVDGQHRVKAFEMLSKDHHERYEQIKDLEVPVIVMANANELQEIDTFVTINKTSKKVDTSLAIVLRNKISHAVDSDDLTMPKAEYIAVELAQALNFREEPHNLWFNKIIFEGNPKNTPQLISLNAFVTSTRVLINQMARKGLISFAWKTKEDCLMCTKICYYTMLRVWAAIRYKWPRLFHGDLENRRIIQGAIGYTAFNKVLVNLLNVRDYSSPEEFLREFEHQLNKVSVEDHTWLPGSQFSKFTSSSGYALVARELMADMNM